ncbi:MAG: DUF6724 family protein [Slackia sp.]
MPPTHLPITLRMRGAPPGRTPWISQRFTTSSSETFQGIGLLVLIGLTISVLACVIMEWKTRRTFKDRGPVEEDEDDFTFFDDED